MVTYSSIRHVKMDEFTSMKGNLAGKFGFKVNSSGEAYNSKEVHRIICKKPFSYSGSIRSLQYHLQAKHPCTPLQQGPSAKTKTTINAFSSRPISMKKEESITQAPTSCLPVGECRKTLFSSELEQKKNRVFESLNYMHPQF
uniref:Putative salivary kunitz domain protein n=1 Tax=Ixodes ricinus TaxID=34613 RepID=A0A6B0UTJ4_IXORI